MINKKLKTTIFIFLILFFAAAVSAESNDNSADTVTIENGMPVSDVAGSFSELNQTIEDASANSIVELNKSYVYNPTTDSNCKDGISIDKNLTIDGQGNTIDGNHTARIFNIQAEGTLTLKNIILANGNATEGGAIYNNDNGYVTVLNATFINNTAEQGGAIYADYTTLNVTDSTFINNTATKIGGAISSASTNIANSTFINNTAASGGAITIAEGTVVDSTFTDNNATKGGAVYLIHGNVTIKNSTFDDNMATNGGAIYYDIASKNTYFNVVGNEFKNNKGVYGNDIYTNHDMVIVNNTFTKTSRANIYADRTLISGTVVSVLGNSTYYLNENDEYNVYTLVTVDGATVEGYNLTIVNDGNSYSTFYAGEGIYQSTENFTADFENSTVYSAVLNVAESGNYTVENGTVAYKQNITIKISVEDIIYGENLTADIILIDGTGKIVEITDNVTVEIDGRNYTVAVINGTGKLDLTDNLMPGNHTVAAFFNGSEMYNMANATADFTVDKRNLKVTAEITEAVLGGNITGNLTLTDENGEIANVTGEVTIEIQGEEFVISVIEGTGRIDIPDEFGPGVYTMNILFNGSEIYNPATGTANFTVEDTGVVFEVGNVTKYYGDNQSLIIVLTDLNGVPIANQLVTFAIHGVNYTRMTDLEGRISMPINLLAGSYRTTVSYGNITRNVTITVLSTINSTDLVKFFRNGTQYYAAFLDVDGNPLANTNVTFNINGVFYTRETDADGIAKLNINLNPGEYIITAINPVNTEYKSNNITVLSTITGQDVVKYFRNGTQYYAEFVDGNGAPLADTDVTFNINGIFYTRTTDSEGIAKLNINLNPGEYIITAINPVNNETYSNMITVLTVVESKDIEMTVSDRKAFTVTILGDHGEPLANAQVSFNIHGIFYHKLTDSNGEISLDINLIAGKYIITTYYNGYAVSNTIVVE